ncbi:E3 ubiquitin-protein ligase ZSWIM2 [Danio aesculapii]|uniref:E3 ubiquitin-protein ligase ZSWIM2 n=1 Tax=Danio aesculapii TaxID=1142201 RepID=UPI0024C06C4D|nr:E3 ubiquitin-protein ligase ZSWIM2 [Danio aesculapii]
MFRKTTWRKTVSDAVSSHQHRALNTTIFILKEYGPIGFLLQEDGESKHYKVCLGDPHTCTCPAFQKEKDLCTHICWILMRKFRLPGDHEYCFQYGLVERQILELLQGLHVTKTTTHNHHGSSGATFPEPADEDGGIRQKVVEKDDICPICQEELLLKKLPVTYCKFSCGNNIHISCMKVWADHQTKKDPRAILKCPLCREDFGTFKELIEQVKNASELVTCYERDCLDKHLGVLCNICRICPIVGKCFKCTDCSFFHLCEDCFKKTLHPKHCFIVRMKRGQQWQTVGAHTSQETQKIENHLTGSSSISMSCDIVPNHVIKSLPVVRVRKESRLLHPGFQCRLCLSRFQLGQHIRTLPCKHKFHTGCIDLLLRMSNCCPLEWHIIYNPLTWSPRIGRAGSLAPSSDVHSKRTDGQISEFFLPGIGLQVKKGTAPSRLRGVTSESSVSGKSSSSSVDTVSQGFQDLCINSSHIEPYSRMPIMTHRKEQRPRRLSFEQAVSAPVERRASFPNRPSTVSMKGFHVQSAFGETQKQQQRLFVGFNGSSSRRIRPLRKILRRRPDRVDVKDLHLWMTNSPASAILIRKQE